MDMLALQREVLHYQGKLIELAKEKTEAARIAEIQRQEKAAAKHTGGIKVKDDQQDAG